MYCIIPLAGPDFYHPSYGIKPLIPYEDKPLIETILKKRSWYQEIEKIILVLQDNDHSTQFLDVVKLLLPNLYPIFLPSNTRGALLSALAGISIISDFSKPIVVDLIDIDYDSSALSISEIFSHKNDNKGFLPYFLSEEPCYSYLVTNQENYLIKSAEKKVLSNKASAGTYFFRNAVTFLSTLPGTVQQEEKYAFNSNLFLCPVYNEIVLKKGKISTKDVPLITSVSKQLKETPLLV